jgi:uncharacterized membrane protein YkoI
MKRQIGIPAACLALAAGCLTAWGDTVPMTQLPEPVQKAIRAQSGGETLQEVERETRDGKVIYEAEFKREGLNRRMQFSEDGTLLPERGVSSVLGRRPSMTVNDVPAPVQKAIREQAAGREVADIDKETWNGQAVYEVEYREQGPNSRIHVTADGSLVVSRDGARGAYMGAQLTEAPAAVQATVKRVAANADVADVDRETEEGKVVYDVELREEGLNRHLKIAESGALLSDSKTKGEGESLRERVRGVFDDRSSVVAMEQLPAAVQSSIKAQGNLGTLKPIKREINDGRVQYDVEFERDGRNTRLTFGEDGRILKDNR